MPNNWKIYKLKDVAELKKRTVQPKDFNDENYIGLEHIGQGDFLLNGLGKASDVTSNKFRFKKGEILYGKIRPYFKKVYKPSFSGICSTDIFIIKSSSEKLVCQEYLYQLIKNQTFTDRAVETSSGTKMPRADWISLANVEFQFPPLPEQKSIASILSALDDKIELNLQMNKTLEEMAMALYKHWFVDFGPFQDGEFVNSELGEIPQGWEVKRLENEFIISIGRTPPRKEKEWFSTQNGVKWISIKDMGNCGAFIFNTSEYLTYEAIQKKKVPQVPPDTVILSFKLTVGRVAITTENMVTNEAIAHFLKKKNTLITPEFLYLTLKSFNYNSLGSTSSIATAVNSQTVRSIRILIPSYDVIENFQKEVSYIFKLIKNNSKEIETLTQLRDTLLPKLISGEVRVKEAEKIFNEVL